MRILIENGSSHLRNMGDAAMLRVTAGRMREAFPGAELLVPTGAPQLLRDLVPGAAALPSGARRAWERMRCLPIPRRLRRWKVGSLVRSAEAGLRRSFPRQAAWAGRRLFKSGKAGESCDALFAAVRACDAVVCCGGGLINDWFPSNGFGVLQTLRVAQRLAKPTAMFGLGLGPVEDRELRRAAAGVLGDLDVLALREGRAGPATLESLGVPASRAVVTGDDAVEPAYLARPQVPGAGIGINIRVAKHAQVPGEAVPKLGRVLRRASERLGAPLVPLPVMLMEGQSDLDAIRELTGDGDVGGTTDVRTPDDLIRRVAGCGIVVSGSYHSSVFALAQGIPTVGLAQSKYYEWKHAGLSEQFDGLSRVLRYDDPGLEEKLEAAIEEAWGRVHQERERLLRAAARQVEASRAAYERFFEVVERKTGIVAERGSAAG